MLIHNYTFVLGVYPIIEYPRILIDISGLTELKGFYIDQNLVLGAGTTLTDTMNIFEKVSNYDYFSYLKTFNEHLRLVAHIPIKNVSIFTRFAKVKKVETYQIKSKKLNLTQLYYHVILDQSWRRGISV